MIFLLIPLHELVTAVLCFFGRSCLSLGLIFSTAFVVRDQSFVQPLRGNQPSGWTRHRQVLFEGQGKISKLTIVIISMIKLPDAESLKGK